MNKLTKISFILILCFFTSSVYAVLPYIVHKDSYVKLKPNTECIHADIKYHTYYKDYKLSIFSNCEEKYYYKHKDGLKILVNRKNNSNKSIGTETNEVKSIHDWSIPQENGKFTKTLVNISNENDIIYIKGKVVDKKISIYTTIKEKLYYNSWIILNIEVIVLLFVLFGITLRSMRKKKKNLSK